METNKSLKIPNNYYCEKCDYLTSNKKDYEKHCDTQKHKNHYWKPLETNLSPKIPNFECIACHKKYYSSSGLWKHRKKCTK